MENNVALLRSIIMDHYEYPRNKRVEEEYKKAHIKSHSCIDDIQVQMKIENNIIQDICFEGKGCTISTASTSVMTELLCGKTISEAKMMIEEYYKMLQLQQFDKEVLQEAVAFSGVGKQIGRINCATIGWKAAMQIIEEKED